MSEPAYGSTPHLLSAAQNAKPEELLETIKALAKIIDDTCLVMDEGRVGPKDRASLPYQMRVVLAAAAKMKTALRQIQVKLTDLQEAQGFLASCQADPKDALATGAMRDAHEWIKNAQQGLQEAATYGSLLIDGKLVQS